MQQTSDDDQAKTHKRHTNRLGSALNGSLHAVVPRTLASTTIGGWHNWTTRACRRQTAKRSRVDCNNYIIIIWKVKGHWHTASLAAPLTRDDDVSGPSASRHIIMNSPHPSLPVSHHHHLQRPHHPENKKVLVVVLMRISLPDSSAALLGSCVVLFAYCPISLPCPGAGAAVSCHAWRWYHFGVDCDQCQF